MNTAGRLAVEAIPTGALALDIALGVGGIPRGCITEIYGPESSGKTTLCLHIIAEAQKRGGTATFIDTENALDLSFAEKCGVDVDNLYVSQPDTGEQAFDIVATLVYAGVLDVIVVDSVAALVPRAELVSEMSNEPKGRHARLMVQALRKLVGIIKQSPTALIFTNQLRQKVGVTHGNAETTTGGMALKSYTSVRLEVHHVGTIEAGHEIVGSRTRATVRKNRLAPPFRMAEFDILYNEGISYEGNLLDVGIAHGIVEVRDVHYLYNEIPLGQGREHAKEFLREHRMLALEIENAICAAAGLPLRPDLLPTLVSL